MVDDVGVDRIGCYGEHPDPGSTPNIDRLAHSGVLFRNAWSSPMCSPTRANVLTGRFGFRTGIGEIIRPKDGVALHPAEWILPELLALSPYGPYENAALGKWHLGSDIWGTTHPIKTGFDRHIGALRNINDYYDWPKSINGDIQVVQTYATTDLIDDTIRTIQTLPEPWFLWVAFNAPHKPFHAPPPHLHSQFLPGAPDDFPLEHVKAAIEAVDTEIGRLLDAVDPAVWANTTVIFLGDNGTAKDAVDAPFDPGHSKGTLFEGGVNVPFIVTGPRVSQPGSECRALVHATDLFSTVAEIGGVDPAATLPPAIQLDSTSLLPYLADPQHAPLREWVYAERFFPNGFGPYLVHRRAVRGARYKLIHNYFSPVGEELLFDLVRDPWEQTNLLQGPLDPEQRCAY